MYQFTVEDATLLVRFGWLCGLDRDSVALYMELYNELGLHGKVLEIDDAIEILVDNNWIEVVNINSKRECVYRCVPIRKLLVRFRSELDEWYGDTLKLCDEVLHMNENEDCMADLRHEVKRLMLRK